MFRVVVTHTYSGRKVKYPLRKHTVFGLNLSEAWLFETEREAQAALNRAKKHITPELFATAQIEELVSPVTLWVLGKQTNRWSAVGPFKDAREAASHVAYARLTDQKARTQKFRVTDGSGQVISSH